MTAIKWDELDARRFRSGVDHVALYVQDAAGNYQKGVPWNGVTKVGESPEGAEATDFYADNIQYASMRSAEKFKFTIEAYDVPDAFDACDGLAELTKGVSMGQQTRAPFGLAWRSYIGDAKAGQQAAYELCVVYGCSAKPSSKEHSTISDSPAAATLSYECSTTPVPVTGFSPTAIIRVNSAKVEDTKLKKLEEKLFGNETDEPKILTPDEIKELLK